MTESMIDRVARALCDSQETTEENWQSWVHAARVVIREMRDPTDEMLNAWARSDKYKDDWRKDCVAGWNAMIDTALSERREKGNG